MITTTISKNAITFLLTASLFLGLVPLTASAIGTGAAAGNFCENIDAARDLALEKVADRQAKTDRSGQYKEKREARLAKLETARNTADEKREEKYEALRDKADTSEKEAAVEEFISTVESLVDTRRGTIDSAITDFEEAVEALMAERKEVIENAASEIKDDVNALFDKAEEACGDGDPALEVRVQFMADMKALREEKQGERDKYSFKDELKEARDERKQAGEAAWETFRSDLADAKAELREAFGG